MSIRFDRVSKAFFKKPHLPPQVILEDVSFEVPSGKNFFILGRSGAGKSVILKHIMGILEPDQGSLWIDEQKLDSSSLVEIRKKCGMVFQQPALLDFLSLYENLLFGFPPDHAASAAEKADRILETLQWVRLEPQLLGLFPHELSYGQQKQASLARALVNQPPYLLFDEPTTGLDPVGSRTIYALITALSAKLKTTSLVVSHDIREALQSADEILFLEKGKILFQGLPADLKHFSHPIPQAFLAG